MENKINIKLLSMAGQGGAAFGIGLTELAKGRQDIMVLSSDMSTPAGLDKFKATYPDMFLNMGIAEQNMIGVAAGLCDEGYRTVCVAQACFITMRSFEQIRQYCGYMKCPLILVGIGSGFSLQYMGNTHYAIEDIALMRTIPNMTIIAPCDALEAKKALECAIDSPSPVYIRLFGGTMVPVVHKEDIDFEPGKNINLRSGKDVAIVAVGSMVEKALAAAELLSVSGIDCSVTDMHTLNPVDKNLKLELKGKKLVVTVEEHRINGGVGTIVSESGYLETGSKLLRLGVAEDTLTPGSYPYMLKETGLDPDNIARVIKENIR